MADQPKYERISDADQPEALASEMEAFADQMDTAGAPIGPWPDSELLREWARIIRGG